MVFIGVDVGTGSARAGVFDEEGKLLGTANRPISIALTDAGYAEQSSTEIWRAVCDSVREAVLISAVAPQQVAGIGFDATCSLVVQGADGGVGADPERDIIVWSDHRATAQSARINALGHSVLDYVGGRISPEMQTPKLLWLKEHRPEVYASAAQFFDLTDFLTWRASGALARSVCTVTCKWTYLAHEQRWDPTYFERIGLGDLVTEDFARIGTQVVPPGTPLEQGLTAEAAQEMGLLPGVAVAAGLIDAHAGGVATVGAKGISKTAEETLAYVFGTSSCTMTSSRKPHRVPGVWGPYQGAMVPGLWLNEGGQSAAGAALDHLCASHPAYPEAQALATANGQPIGAWLADHVMETEGSLSERIQGLHVVPEYLGNRAPHADPDRRAVISGLGLQTGLGSLERLYVAGLCGLAYGLCQIIDAQAAEGLTVKAIALSGGAGSHPLSGRIIADVTGLPIEISDNPEPVLLGSAMLGSVAAGRQPDLGSAMSSMSGVAHCYAPDPSEHAAHRARYRAYTQLQELALTLQGV